MNRSRHALDQHSAEPPWAAFQSFLEDETRRRQIFPGLQVLAYESIKSTNDICMGMAQKVYSGPLVVLANHQSAGRGRQGSQWSSAANCNLLLSLLLEVGGAGHDLLSLAVSLAAVDAIERTAQSLPLDCRVKWPNDILLAGRKVAGILIEKPAATGSDLAVIGIGINVNQPSFPPEISQQAVSLAMVCGGEISRLKLATELLAGLQRWLSPPPDKDFIAAQWKARCDMLGQRVSIQCRGTLIHGIVADVDPFDGLVLRQDNGVLRVCHAATSRMVRGDPAT